MGRHAIPRKLSHYYNKTNSFRILFLKLLEFALTETWLKQLLFILEEKRKAQLIAASN